MTVEISYQEAAELYGKQGVVSAFYGKSGYAIAKTLKELKKGAMGLYTIQNAMNEFKPAYDRDFAILRNKNLKGEELEKESKKVFDKHQKYFDRSAEINYKIDETAKMIFSYESFEVKTTDMEEQIRNNMNVAQQVYLMDIGVIAEPVPPSAGLELVKP